MDSSTAIKCLLNFPEPEKPQTPVPPPPVAPFPPSGPKRPGPRPKPVN